MQFTKKTLATLIAAAILFASHIRAADHADHDHDHAPATKPATSAAPHAHDDHADHADHDHGGHADEVKLTPEAIKSNNIQIAPAKKRTLASTVTAPARIAYDAEAMAHVGSPIKGRVAEVKAKLGQEVKQGDVLLIIESPELAETQSDLIEKLSLVGVAQAAVGPTKESYDRGKKLFEEHQGLPFAEVQQRLAAWKSAEGAVIAATAAAAKAKSRLQVSGMTDKSIDALITTGKLDPTYVIRAPITGRVISREATHGELVNPDRDKLLEIADMSKVWAWVDVPESKLAGIAEKNQVTIHTAIKDPIQGVITHIAPEMDPATRSAKVRVELPNPSGALRIGMFASAEIETDAGKDAAVIAIPDAAIQTIEGSSAVFVPVDGEPNTFAVRKIAIGKSAAGFVEVTAGLKEGENFVTENSFILKAELGKAGAEHTH